MKEALILHKIGINYANYFTDNIEETLRNLADIGFEAVFTGHFAEGPTETFANAAFQNGLAYESIHAPYDRINDIWYAGEPGEAMLARLCDCVKTCGKYQIPIAVVHLSSGENPPRINDIGYRRFAKLIEEAVKNNVTLAFENQRKLANLAFIFETFSNVEQVKFCWDVGHEACFTDGIEFMELFGKKAVYTHIHDNFSQYNRDLHLIPFDGNIDFYRCAQLLKKHNYNSTLTLEILPKASDLYTEISFDAYYRKAFSAAKKLRDMLK